MRKIVATLSDGTAITLRTTFGLTGNVLFTATSDSNGNVLFTSAGKNGPEGQILWCGPGSARLYYVDDALIPIRHSAYDNVSGRTDAREKALAFFVDSGEATITHLMSYA
jgi:hypothetical protein